MKTQHLIEALAADHAAKSPSIRSVFAIGLAAGCLVSIAVFLAALGVRPDIEVALHSGRFLLKFLLTITLGLTAGFLFLRLMRPESSRVLWPLLVAPCLLAVAVPVEMITIPSGDWVAHLFGTTWLVCLVSVPLLSLGPLAALLLVARQGATMYPATTGAVTGFLAGAVGATIYAAHCPGDSPLFVLAWYAPPLVLLSLAGAHIGTRILRW